jgi:hypothetical protein
MFRGKWSESDKFETREISVVGKVKKDSYNWWFFIDGIDWR